MDIKMIVAKVDANNIFGNWAFVSNKEFDPKKLTYGKINDTIIQIKPVDWIEQGKIGLNLLQRRFFNVEEGAMLEVAGVSGLEENASVLKEIHLQLIHQDKSITEIPEKDIERYMDYVYHALFATHVSDKHPEFLIPHPFNDDDVVVVHVFQKKDGPGIINDETEVNLVH
jgi:hypothetical protein